MSLSDAADVATIVLGGAAFVLAYFGLRTWIIQHHYSAYFTCYEALWLAITSTDNHYREGRMMTYKLMHRYVIFKVQRQQPKAFISSVNEIAQHSLEKIEAKYEASAEAYKFAVSKAQVLLQIRRDELVGIHNAIHASTKSMMNIVRALANEREPDTIVFWIWHLIEFYAIELDVHGFKRVSEKPEKMVKRETLEENNDYLRKSFVTYISRFNPIDRLNRVERFLFHRNMGVGDLPKSELVELPDDPTRY